LDHGFVEPDSSQPRTGRAGRARSAEIKDEIEAWREAALRAADAGFEAVEIHGAHGY